MEFKSYYVAKIIDYGRSYIVNGVDLKKELCKTPLCKPDCGTKYGFGWLNDNLTPDNFFISSIKKNESHDLRLINSIFPQIVKYGVGIPEFENNKLYGTEPNINPIELNLITNVTGVKITLNNYFREPNLVAYFRSSLYSLDKKFGEMHVYLDLSKDVQFVKT